MKINQVEVHKGLNLKSCEVLESKVVAVVGINGAGKSRLLEAIFEGKIKITTGENEIPREQILHLTAERLQPNFIFGFNPVQHKANIDSAKALYRQHCGKFQSDLRQTIVSLGPISGRMQQGVNSHLLANTVIAASRATGKDLNSLDDQDIADAYSIEASQLGTLSVTATMLEYLARQDENNYNEFRNNRYAQSLPYRTDDEFNARFGPPPWEVLNDVLKSVFDGRYYVQPPVPENTGGYEARLTRQDGVVIDPGVLSSGERVLLWLSLSMYIANSNQAGITPRLLLLDEPDATLHPQMIQSLHKVLSTIAKQFGCYIVFTTHSPTTVALFDGPIYQVSEDDLVPVEQDVAIGELLIGVDQVSIYFSNRRQVYVESHIDAEIYSTLFRLLKQWGLTSSAHISLSFAAASPKLSEIQIKDDLMATFGTQDDLMVKSFINRVNGHGNNVQVIGVVEELALTGNDTVYGIIDWDDKNKSQNRIHVHGIDTFYSMENAILNPLTLGLYILHNFCEKIEVASFGLVSGFDLQSIYNDHTLWQKIADEVTKKVLGIDDVKHEVECSFIRGGTVKFDKRYVHTNGHELEKKILAINMFTFLKAVRRSLMLDVLKRGIEACHGRTLPSTFKDLFGAIQLAGQASVIEAPDQFAACKPMTKIVQ
jgi:ABC-type cobalamin/Fe3+-siderophores transport system ATPase subunit